MSEIKLVDALKYYLTEFDNMSNDALLKGIYRLQKVYDEKNFSTYINELEQKIISEKAKKKDDIKWCLVGYIALVLVFLAIYFEGIHIVLIGGSFFFYMLRHIKYLINVQV